MGSFAFLSYAPTISAKNPNRNLKSVTLTLTFQPQNHVTSRICHRYCMYQVCHSFLSYAPNITVKMHLLTL